MFDTAGVSFDSLAAGHDSCCEDSIRASCVSPSLISYNQPEKVAYEIKFVLDESLASLVEEQLRPSLSIDVHADPRLDHSYRVTSTYADTPEFDVFHRRGDHRHRKFRVRRYGASELAFLEQKFKRGMRVAKLRSTVEAHWLSDPAMNDRVPEELTAYQAQLDTLQLRPVCQVEYLRRAYYGTSEQGPIRLTFDRQLRGRLTDGWAGEASTPWQSLLDRLVVCEIKFQESIPLLFKAVLQQFQIVPGGYSKFRRCLELCAAPVHTQTIQADEGASDA